MKVMARYSWLLKVTSIVSIVLFGVISEVVAQPSTCTIDGGTKDIETQQTVGGESVAPGVAPEGEFCSENSAEWNEWHFVITSVASGKCPAAINLDFLDGPDETVNLESQTGGTCHYRLINSHLDDTLLSATAEIYDEWKTGSGCGNGNFNVSHAPCSETEGPPGEITACKFYDSNADGSDEGESTLSGWPMTIDPVDGAEQPATQLTGEDGCVTWTPLDEGSYTVTEGIPNEMNWFHSTDTSFAVNVGDTVQFGNYCTVPSGGKTPGYWQNKNGQAKIAAADLTALTNLCLVKADGSDFDPSSAADVGSWILADAVNMAYKLSSHLAAMTLNLNEGYVNGNSFDLCSDQTVSELVDEANSALCADGNTPNGDPNRSEQEALKNCLDALNNNGPVVPPTPNACPYTFPTE